MNLNSKIPEIDFERPTGQKIFTFTQSNQDCPRGAS